MAMVNGLSEADVCEKLLKELSQIMSNNERRLFDWGLQTTNWAKHNIDYIVGLVKGKRSVTLTGCKIVTAILQHHQQYPSSSIRDFVCNTVLPVVIDSMADESIVSEAAHRALIVAILQTAQQVSSS